jgi:SAM-dependent methyltransferase
MKEFWDQRYSEPGFVYGQEPNLFFKQVIDELRPGKLLLPGEGEGRNAVYAAGLGWDVTAFDQSRVARKKALAWAGELGLTINYLVGDLSDLSCYDQEYDLIAIVYTHLVPQARIFMHRRLEGCLIPGGTIIMECFHKDQLNYATGGPRVAELLYHEDEIRNDFSRLSIKQCENLVLDVHEGKYHSGESSVVRLIARKPLNNE